MPTPRRDVCPGFAACRSASLTAFLAVLLTAPATGFAAETPAKPSAPQFPASQAAPADQQLTDASRIAAVVNGDVISEADIGNRARLFAISTGLPLSTEVIDRLKSQILRQLIDERLRVQEAQRRKIVIQDAQIAAAIKDIETRNNLQPGALRAKLAADGVSTRTLIDQIRAQLAWTQMLRSAIGDKINISRRRGRGSAEAGCSTGRSDGIPPGGNLHPRR